MSDMNYFWVWSFLTYWSLAWGKKQSVSVHLCPTTIFLLLWFAESYTRIMQLSHHDISRIDNKQTVAPGLSIIQTLSLFAWCGQMHEETSHDTSRSVITSRSLILYYERLRITWQVKNHTNETSACWNNREFRNDSIFKDQIHHIKSRKDFKWKSL